jgi:hypothetical protein
LEIDFSDKNWSDLRTALGRLMLNHEVGDVFIAITCKGDPSYHLIMHYDNRLDVLEEERENFEATSTNVTILGPKAFDGKYLLACLGKNSEGLE